MNEDGADKLSSTHPPPFEKFWIRHWVLKLKYQSSTIILYVDSLLNIVRDLLFESQTS